MLEYILQQGSYLFLIPITLGLLLLILEVFMILIGAALSDLIEIDVNVDSTSIASWLGFGKVPFIIWLYLFLTVFGSLGLALQYFLEVFHIPLLIIIFVTFTLTVMLNRVIISVLEKIMPKDETYAMSERDLIGLRASIVLGTCKEGSPTEAKIISPIGETIYLMVEPFNKQDILYQGDFCFIHSKHDAKDLYYVIPLQEVLQ